MLAAFIGVRLTSPGPAVFSQVRTGRRGAAFTLLKFRTMTAGESGPQVTASRDARITRVGRLLRRTKIDELPGLWNVLRGDMSVVGPRPEVPRYVNMKDPLWQEVLQARPGLTDPVTIRLRNEEHLLAAVSGDREAYYLATLQPYKLRGYRSYLAHRTAWSDVRVLAKTIAAVVLPRLEPVPTAEEIAGSRSMTRFDPRRPL